MLKLCFLHTDYHNCNIFRTILIILRQLQNINKAYVKTWMDYEIHENLCIIFFRYYKIRL